MTEELYSHLASFFSLAVQFRRHPLIFWGGRGEGVHAQGAGKQLRNLLPFPVGHLIAGSPSSWFIFPLPFLLPLFLFLPGFSPRRHLRGFLGGATQLASEGWFCSERQSSPRLSWRLPIAEPWRQPVAWLR